MAAHVSNRISTLNLQPQNCCSLSIAHATLQQWRLFTVTVWQWNETHFASMCSRKSTVITDHWVHGDLQCRSTSSTICYFLHNSPKSMRAIHEKQRKKRHGLTRTDWALQWKQMEGFAHFGSPTHRLRYFVVITCNFLMNDKQRQICSAAFKGLRQEPWFEFLVILDFF